MKKLINSKLLIQVIVASMVATLATAGFVAAATTIGTNIETAGTLAAGATTLTGTLAVSKGVTVGAAYGLDTVAAGVLNIGTTTANAITIGKAGVTTTNAGALTVTEALANTALTASRMVFTDASKVLASTGASAAVSGAVSDETGTGVLVFATSPTLVTPLLGTPTSGVATNLTGLPLTTGVTGILPTANGGTGIAFFTAAGPTAARIYTFPDAAATIARTDAGQTFTGVNTMTSPIFVTPALGTPASGVATNLTGTAAGLTAGNVTTNANLTGNVTSVGNATTIAVLPAISGALLTNLTAANISAGTAGISITGNAATVTTNANLTGDVTSVGNATTLTNAPVIAKLLTGYVSGAGAVAATDSILAAIQKLNGNDATNANLTGDVTSVGNATTIAVLPAISGALLTNLTAANISAGTITATLSGNATSATTATNLAGGAGGSIPYQSAAGTTAMLANGTAGQVLQSNGTTVAPSWATIVPTLGGANTWTGANIFNDTKLLLRNVANTFNGSFVNTNTADRIYTLQDRAGTLADNTDLALKANLASPTFTGTVTLPSGQALVAPALGTPASGTLTNATGLPIATGVNGLSAGVATALATPSSANLITAVTDETGTGALVFATSPTFTGQVKKSVQAGITAFATGGQASAVAITADIAEVTIVATAADSVKLPTAVAGMQITVINKAAANSMGLFPASGNNINEAANDAVYNVAAKVTVICTAIDAVKWECQKMAR